MKFNWGVGIALVSAGFMIFMLNLVYRCSNEKVELVSEAYYENELRYQDRIDRQLNSRQAGVLIDISSSADSVVVRFPGGLAGSPISGAIHFFRPDASSDDFSVPVSVDSSSCQLIAISGKRPGRWRVQIEWSSDGKPFYQEEEIWIQ